MKKRELWPRGGAVRSGAFASGHARWEGTQISAASTIERLAQWVHTIDADGLAPPAVAWAKLLILDTIGCAFAALKTGEADGALAAVDALAEGELGARQFADGRWFDPALVGLMQRTALDVDAEAEARLSRVSDATHGTVCRVPDRRRQNALAQCISHPCSHRRPVRTSL